MRASTNRCNGLKTKNAIKILKEDILRILCERSKKTLESIEDEIKVTRFLISEAIKELERDNLIIIQEDSISLTELGQENAKSILDKHFALEDYLEKTGSKIGKIIGQFIGESMFLTKFQVNHFF